MIVVSSEPRERPWFVPRLLVGPLLAASVFVLIVGGLITLLCAGYGRVARAYSPT